MGRNAAIDDAGSTPRVAPRTEEGVALVLRTAHQERWRLRIEGTGSWVSPEAPADVALSTRQLAGASVRAADLVASVEAGVRWTRLRSVLGEAGTWVPLDPPGGDRSLGSVIATATAGPLQSGFGAVRDHLLGLTLVTGEGRIVKAGGQVVKNVAGFDLTRLATGTFGRLGVITSAHLRLRVVPRADTTLVAYGERDWLLETARAIRAAGRTPAALQLVSPAVLDREDWMLAIRLVGSDPTVRAERDAVAAVGGPSHELAAADAAALWHRTLAPERAGPVTLRLGTLPSSLEAALDLVHHHLPESHTTAAVDGALRWSGDTSVDRLRLLRRAAAQLEMPVTIERAPWSVLREMGHYGAYREGVGRLLHSLHRSFDPGAILVTAFGDDR